MLPTLCEGGFVERGHNLLAFGLPGRGKTHLVCAIGYELIQRGYRVLFTATFALVQRLLAAKRDLRLEKDLASLDASDAVTVRQVEPSRPGQDIFEFLRSLPPGTRSKEDIDQQMAEERDSWGDR
jgi:hypothetical protein